MIRAFIALAVLALAACGTQDVAPPEPPADVMPAELAQAAEAYERAQLGADSATMADIVADDYVLITSNGDRRTKGQLIDLWMEPGFDPQRVQVTDPVQILWRDGAALGGTAHITGVQKGLPFTADIRYIDIWQLRDGKWRVVYGQTTRTTAQPQPQPPR